MKRWKFTIDEAFKGWLLVGWREKNLSPPKNTFNAAERDRKCYACEETHTKKFMCTYFSSSVSLHKCVIFQREGDRSIPSSPFLQIVQLD